MASLEFIQFTPMREVVERGGIEWEQDNLSRRIEKLPQLYWNSGDPWSEANLWALSKTHATVGNHIKTITSLMKHLCAYADWLEVEGLDWRHFPERKADRSIIRYRGELIAQRNRGNLRPSTVTARMRAVIQFYSYAQDYGFVSKNSPVSRGDVVLFRYFDTIGFERTLRVQKSELSIPNRRRPGLRLEDGLVSIESSRMQQLLNFTAEEELEEIHLMLTIGLLTGARRGSISTLTLQSIEGALPDPNMPGFYRLPIGPGTGVDTKFDVSGDLLFPCFLIDALKVYAYSMPRLSRQALASPQYRNLLFLTSHGNPYSESSFNRLMTDLRRRAVAGGMKFMQTFKFHQTRCTYGTWLMELALRVTTEANAIAFVRDAMLHKDEATTLRYIRFIQQAPVKALISSEFTAAFTGVFNRDWSKFHA